MIYKIQGCQCRDVVVLMAKGVLGRLGSDRTQKEGEKKFPGLIGGI